MRLIYGEQIQKLPAELRDRFRGKYAQVKSSVWEEVRASWGLRQFLPSFHYLLTTESHVYAFSIAANALLAFFPFVLILMNICTHWLHWQTTYNAILQLVNTNLPKGADFVTRGLVALVRGRRQVEIITVLLMFYTSSGVFLPLEVALNKVWGFTQNRSLVHNLLISFALAVLSGVLALLSVSVAGVLFKVVAFLFGWLPWHPLVAIISRTVLEAVSIPLMIAIYFVIYYLLPNGKVPALKVFPAAVLAGVCTEIVKLVYFLTLPLLHFNQTYGPFAVPVTLLFWAYVGSIVMLWGAYFSAQRPLSFPSVRIMETRHTQASDGAERESLH